MTRDARDSTPPSDRIPGGKLSYADAGVDIDAGEAFVERDGGPAEPYADRVFDPTC